MMPELRFDNYRYRGASAPSPYVTLAFGQSGALQVELIAQLDDTPSTYRDFLDSGREGPQHLAYWYDDPSEYDRAYQHLAAQKLSIRQESTGPGPRFSYFSRGEGIYPEIELAVATIPSMGGWMDMVAKASVGWDGADPVRLADGTPMPMKLLTIVIYHELRLYHRRGRFGGVRARRASFGGLLRSGFANRSRLGNE